MLVLKQGTCNWYLERGFHGELWWKGGGGGDSDVC